MNWIEQQTPYGCGQACVAMVSGKSFEDVCKVMNKKGKTRSVHLAHALAQFGRHCDNKATRYKGEKLPFLCICRCHYKGYPGSHWVVHNNGKFYDPVHGIRDKVYPEGIAYITSYLEVHK